MMAQLESLSGTCQSYSPHCTFRSPAHQTSSRSLRQFPVASYASDDIMNKLSHLRADFSLKSPLAGRKDANPLTLNSLFCVLHYTLAHLLCSFVEDLYSFIRPFMQRYPSGADIRLCRTSEYVRSAGHILGAFALHGLSF